MRRESGTRRRRRASSACGNGVALAQIRGWPRTTGQHATVGRRLRRGRCSLVGTDRHELEVAGHLVRPHGAGREAARDSLRFRRSNFISIFHSIFDSRVELYNLEYKYEVYLSKQHLKI